MSSPNEIELYDLPPFCPLYNLSEATSPIYVVLGLQVAFPIKLQWQVGGKEAATL